MTLNVRTKILLSFTISLILLCAAILTVSLTSIYQDSVEYSTTSAAGQLEHIDGTISMYLKETLNNTVMMAKDPRAIRTDEILTNYLDKTKELYNRRPHSRRHAGQGNPRFLHNDPFIPSELQGLLHRHG